MSEQKAFGFEDNPTDEGVSIGREIEAARTIARSTDPDSKAAARAAFAEVERLALACRDPKTQMQAYEASGDFHAGRGDLGTAEKKYKIALESARLLSVTSDDGVKAVERLLFKLNKTRNGNDPVFKNLENVARGLYPYEKQNSAWASYQNDKGDSTGRLAARSLGSEEDFRSRLDAAESAPVDDEDEEIRW
jgi:hypothetical protein